MNIEINQIYSRKIINFNCSALVIGINNFIRQTIKLEILTGGLPGYTFNISTKKLREQFEFNEKLTNEYIIKSIIE